METPNPAASVETLELKVARLTQALAEERARRTALALDGLVEARQLTPTEVPAALTRALKDESYLRELRMRTPLQAGACPQ